MSFVYTLHFVNLLFLGLLSHLGPSHENGDQRILLITIRDLLQHTSGWDQRVTGDHLFHFRNKNQLMWSKDQLVGNKDQLQTMNKGTVLRLLMNVTLQNTPG